ncbi:type II toxin-antitoxin system RelE/ParE family toxin [Deinococcus sp. Leaf326]|uniref:type II toxin-antitoxin system RelE/ParE family toxin n=1 Tax=Deinococcus sp. Leaf326 TaxID=1736338 RepID=UPI0009EA4AE2|nr:type II toxin-antitoxin system RelE/ParE family toxin [Deinococcus sp. Leaf326]
MHIQYRRPKIEALVETRAGAAKYPPEIVDRLFEVLDVIAAASEEKQLYQFKGLRYELLRGKRKGEASMRLNDQWRLIVAVHEDSEGFFAEIIDIEDYH